MNTQSVRFGTHHFPVGTLFRVKETVRFSSQGEDKDEVFEVKNIVRNGEQSFVIQTTKPKESSAFEGLGMLHSFNIAHVREIVKRGDGPVEVLASNYKFLDEYIDSIVACAYSAKNTVMQKNPQAVRKNDLCFYRHDLERLVWLYSTINTDSQTFWVGNISSIFERSSLFRKVDAAWGPVVVVNKKRFKRWVRQNQNRFLTSVKKAQQESDDEMDKAMEDSFDRYLDDEYPETTGSQEGSWYSDDDGYSPSRERFLSESVALMEELEESDKVTGVGENQQVPTDDELINKISKSDNL